MALDREILTVKEVGEALRVHPSTLYRLVREGRIPAFQGRLRMAISKGGDSALDD